MSNNYFSKLTNPDFWKKPKHLWLSLFILVGLVIIVLIVVRLIPKISPPEQIEVGEEPGIVPSEVVPLASGKQTYEIITGSSPTLQIIEADIDPLDVKQRETQTVTIQVKDSENNPITKSDKVEAIVYTDNISTPFSFSLKKVEDLEGAIIATWQGSWVREDTYNLKYMMRIKAKNATKEHTINLSFR